MVGAQLKPPLEGQDPHAAALLASSNAALHFSDPDAFTSAIPGGQFGALPLERSSEFEARLRIANLSDGVVIRNVTTSDPVVIRSQFIGSPKVITFICPLTDDPKALIDGKTLSDTSLLSRLPGDTPQMRTYGKMDLSLLVLFHDHLRRTSAALTGREHEKLLTCQSQVKGHDPAGLRAFKRRYSQIRDLMLAPHHPDMLSMRTLNVMRGELVGTLVDLIAGGETRNDHLAYRLQTASMRRIEAYIDETRHDAAGLQELCEATGLALRTVETIIKRRTGLTAHRYLTSRKLAFVREDLLAPERETNVTQVAMHYGFFHLGRFSGLYRKTYGETPSTTLQRTLGRARKSG